MKIDANISIGDIVKENYQTAGVFDAYGIDFCCGGDISLEKACEQSQVDMDELLSKLEIHLLAQDPDSSYLNKLELDELCDYIEKRHHSYVNEHIPFLQVKLQKLCDVHGDHHPELFQIKEEFDGAAENLSVHMKKEELLLFPLIRKLARAKKDKLEFKDESGEFMKTMEALDEEHQTEGDRFKRISSLSNSYTCPPDGCQTFQVSYQTLKDFEQDLHRHVHLENNVLFKKARAHVS